MKLKLFLLVLVSPFILWSQSEDLYKSNTVPSALKDKSNACIRYNNIQIEVQSFDKMILTKKRIVTVYNKKGNRTLGAVAGYDDNINIKSLEAIIYDDSGKQIKKIKKNDFADESAVSGSTLYSDSRVKYLNYTPISYPYTMEFNAVVEYKSTAFVPEWNPIESYYTSTQYSEYNLVNKSDVELRVKATNLDDFNIEAISDYHYKATDLASVAYEEYSPDFDTFTPNVKAALVNFSMEGVNGVNSNWKEFGKWMNETLIADTQQLPENVINHVKSLTANVEDPIEKAKIVYNFMQDKTRYISVQVGIGGWKPIDALEVDKNGYGDCKGLTNYTQALLKEVGVESYYTVIYGDSGITHIDKDFSSTQGNHVILCVPDNDDYIWLECTSQTNPFGLIAGFTDDRDALVIKPEGGEIVRTKQYSPEESLQLTTANVTLDASGSFQANVEIKTTGYQYSLREGYQNKEKKEQDIRYKSYWGNINNLVLNDIKFENDKDKIEFTELASLTAENYASKTGDRLLLQPNMFNVVSSIPARYTTRTLDFEIERGFKDEDQYVVEFPSNLAVEALPESVSINTKFGIYSFSVEALEANKIRYTRTYVLNKGKYTKNEYEEFRDFRKLIAKHDKAKMVLKIN